MTKTTIPKLSGFRHSTTKKVVNAPQRSVTVSGSKCVPSVKTAVPKIPTCKISVQADGKFRQESKIQESRIQEATIAETKTSEAKQEEKIEKPAPSKFNPFRTVEKSATTGALQVSKSTALMHKFVLNVAMTQSGKTFVTINHITSIEDQVESILDTYQQDSIHFIFCMNSKLNCAQFACRVRKVMENHLPGTIVQVSSDGSSDVIPTAGEITHYNSINQVFSAINVRKARPGTSEPKVVVMCSNSSRYDDLDTFLEDLRVHSLHKNVYIYYDELHSYISALRLRIEDLHDNPFVTQIMGLSATPEIIFHIREKWKALNIYKIDECNIDYNDYIGCKEMKYNHIDPPQITRKARQGVEYAKHVLGFHHSDILRDGNRVFIPADEETKTHFETKRAVLVHKPDAVVIIINGDSKIVEIHAEGKETIIVKLDDVVVEGKQVKKPIVQPSNTLKLKSKSKSKSKKVAEDGDDSEVCEKIGQVVKQYSLDKKCIVVTGHLCISQGQTLAHETWGNFTHAIIGHTLYKNHAIYQLFGRLTGRIKSYKTYTQTVVYCPRDIKTIVQQLENNAKVIAVLYSGKVITGEEYANAYKKIDEANRRLTKIHLENRLDGKDIGEKIEILQQELQNISERMATEGANTYLRLHFQNITNELSFYRSMEYEEGEIYSPPMRK